jgi:rubrerythrin
VGFDLTWTCPECGTVVSMDPASSAAPLFQGVVAKHESQCDPFGKKEAARHE